MIEGYTWQEERQMVIAEKFASNQGTMGNIGGAVGGFMMGGAMGGSIVDIARSALDPEKIPTEKPPKNVSGTSSHVGQAPSSIKVNEIPKKQRKSPCGTSGFFSAPPLDFRREKEHLKDKRTLDYHGRIRRKLGIAGAWIFCYNINSYSSSDQK